MKEKILANNIDSEQCLIPGDFNFVASILDRNSQNLNRIDICSSKEWEFFEDTLRLQDTFRLTNKANRQYTWTSKANKKLKARLDRIYYTFDMYGKMLATSISVTNLSDHKIIKLKMATSIEKGNGMWIFNNTHLQDPSYCIGITEIAKFLCLMNRY